MRAAGYTRSAEALATHFRTSEHEPLSQPAPAPAPPAATETHPGFYWTPEEERELWRLTEQFADKKTGRVAWQKVHDQLEKVRRRGRERRRRVGAAPTPPPLQDGHERSMIAIKAHLRRMQAA